MLSDPVPVFGRAVPPCVHKSQAMTTLSIIRIEFVELAPALECQMRALKNKRQQTLKCVVKVVCVCASDARERRNSGGDHSFEAHDGSKSADP